jgi:hypothetical protein
MPTIGGEIVLTGEVKAMQATLKAQLENVRTALQRCATSGTFSPDKTPGEWDAWQSLKTRIESYVAETPSWLESASQYTRGELLQKELYSWFDRAKGLGCDAGPAPPLPPKPDVPILSTAGLSQIAILVIIAMVVMKKK